MKSKSKTEQAQLARYAFNNQWWDLSVQATIAGKLWDHLEERFPLAYNDLFKRYTSGKEIPQSYAMAIARQESAWNPKVKSPVGQRPDADYAWYRDPYGEDVLYSRL